MTRNLDPAHLELLVTVAQLVESRDLLSAENDALVALLSDVLAVVPQGYMPYEHMMVLWRARAVLEERKA